MFPRVFFPTIFATLMAVLGGYVGPVYADAPPRLLFAPVVSAPPNIAGGSTVPPSVVVVLTIDSTGSVSDASIRRGLDPETDARVLAAARELQFSAAQMGDLPVASRITFRYRLQPLVQTASPSSNSPSAASSAPTTPPLAPPSAALPLVVAPAPAPVPAEQGITVVGQHEAGAATRMSLRGEELTTVPGSFGDATRAVAALPGVGRATGGFGGTFAVRGSDLQNTGFFIDGYPVLNLYHFGAGPAIIPSQLIGQLDFYPGGYPVEFGRFTGGVISAETAAPHFERPHLEISVDLLRAELLGVLPFANGRGTLTVSARRSYFETLLPHLSPGIQLNYADGSIRLEYRLSDRVRTSLFFFSSYDFYDSTQASTNNALAGFTSNVSSHLEYSFWRAIAKVEYRAPGGLLGRYSAMVGYDDSYETNAHTVGVLSTFHSAGYVFGERASLRLPTTGLLSTTVGLDALAHLYRTNTTTASNQLNVSSPGEVTQSSVAAYVEEVLHVRRFELAASLRFDFSQYGNNSFILPEPRVVARLRVTDRTTLVASSGMFTQVPQLFMYFINLGNAVIPPERAWQNSLSVEARLPFEIDGRATAFLNRTTDISETTFGRPLGPVEAVPLDTRSDVTGLAYGLELFARRRLSRGIYGWISYTLSRSERSLPGQAPTLFWADQTHIFNTALSWEIDSHWRVGARFQIASGRPTQQVTTYFDTDENQYVARAGAQTDRTPMFHQLDLRVDYRFRIGPTNISAYVDIMNVYNYPNSEQWSYQYDGRARQPGPGIPILPTVGLRGEL